jgi:16S rRNA (cytidine1402-2'-O)-methyltransferase
MSGTLYLVSTPIGNLADITYRAVETLKTVQLIACEDTRQTRKLLEHYGISTPVISCHEHNERARAAEIASRLVRGDSVALVSDAGTPIVSDPGFRIVQKALEHGAPVVPIPGPSAALAALAASGLPCATFRFEGFLPRKHGERLDRLRQLSSQPGALVLYEAPHRVLETLRDIEAELRDPPVAVARELTKIHEEILRGAASAVRRLLESRPSIRGEFTLVVLVPEKDPGELPPVEEAVRTLESAGVPRMEAMKTVARERGLSKREVYRRLQERGLPG